jgi:hypothetical protein
MEGAKVELESEGKARLHGSGQHEIMRRFPCAFVHNLGRYAPTFFEQYITVKNRRCGNVITMNR